jgi:hypothetical protein
MLAMSTGITKAQAEFLESTKSTVSVGNSASRPDTSTTSKLDDDDETVAMRQARWITIFPHYEKLSSMLQSLLKTMRGWKQGAFRWQFSSISDFVSRTSQAWSRPAVFSKEEQQLFSQPGRVRELFLEFVAKFQQEFGGLFATLKSFLEVSAVVLSISLVKFNCVATLCEQKRKQDEDRRRYLELVSFEKSKDGDGDSQSEKRQQTLHKLQSLGMKQDEMEGLLLDDGSQHNPLLHAHSLETDKMLGDASSLSLFETIVKSIQGPHSIEIYSGNNRLTTQIHGLDILELLPVLPSIQQVLHETSFSKKK